MAIWSLLGTALSGGAHAQLLMRYLPQSVPGYQLDPTLQVLQNGGPDYRGTGIRVGNFILHPAVDETFAYNSNPLGFSQPRGSPELDTSASASINSDWSRNSIGLSGSVDDQRYTALPVADQTNYNLFGGGRLDWGRDSLDVSAGFISSNLGPTDVLTRGLSSPVPYRSADVRAAYTAVLSRWRLIPSVDITTYRFGTAAAGLGVVDDTALDKNQIAGGLTVTYELSPGRNLVAAVQESAAFLLHRAADQRSAHYLDTLAVVGLDYDTFAAFRYDLLFGWELREWSGETLPARQTPVIEASVTWRPTLLTTLSAAATRHLSDASYDVANNLAFSEGKVTVFHELYRNIILQADVDVQATDGDASGGGRITIATGVGATWLFNPRLRLNVLYNFSHGDFAAGETAAVGGNYASNTIQFSVHFGY